LFRVSLKLDIRSGLVKKFYASSGNQKLLISFTSVHYWTLSQHSWIQPTPST